jgi:serine phosphatase RsbU (regulator of sigma subunit)
MKTSSFLTSFLLFFVSLLPQANAENEIQQSINEHLFYGETLEDKSDFYGAYQSYLEGARLALEDNLHDYATEIYIKALTVRIKYQNTQEGSDTLSNGPFLELCRLLQQSLSQEAQFWHEQAIKHCLDQLDTSCALYAYSSFALNRINKRDNEEALGITKEAIELAKAYGDSARYGRILLDYADLLNKLGNFDEADKYADIGYHIMLDHERKNLTLKDYHWSIFFIELKAFIQYSRGNLNKSEELFLATLDSVKSIASRGGNPHSDIKYITYVRLGRVYFDMNEHEKAEELFDKAEILKNDPKNRGFNPILLFENMILTFSNNGNYKKAFSTSEKYREYINDSYLAAQKQHNKTQRELATLNIVNAQKEISLLKEKTQKASQKNRIIMLSTGIIGVGAVAILLSIITRQKHKNNQSLINKNRLIIDQKNEITSSIEYAEKIQAAILPSRQKIQEFFPNNVIFYLPRDIVSGDFYWMYPSEEKTYLACVDCTGHGVPGAIVSMIGHNSLNNSINRGHTATNAILDDLNENIERTFNQNEIGVNDGMDIAIIAYNKNKKEIEYSGANMPIFVVRKGNVIVYKPDKQPIGKFIHRNPFTAQTIELESGDMVYMTSDGLQDQFGGEKNKKFKIRRLKSLMIEMAKQSPEEQLETLSMSYFDWIGNNEQVDDICFIGFKVD